LTDLSTVLSQCTRVTDRRTDRILIARPRLHSMQRGKNQYWGFEAAYIRYDSIYRYRNDMSIFSIYRSITYTTN